MKGLIKLTNIFDARAKKHYHLQPSSGNYSDHNSSSNYADISGTSFSFKCNTSSNYSKVLFEISIQTGWGNDSSNNSGDMKMLQSSDQTNWTDIEASKIRMAIVGSYHESSFEHKFSIIPWQGIKYFKLQIKQESSSTEFTINRRGWTTYPWLSPPIINVRVI